MSATTSTSNFLPAAASLLIAGSGQLIQGRKIMATVQFLLWLGLWAFMAGWAVTIWSVVDAAIYTEG